MKTNLSLAAAMAATMLASVAAAPVVAQEVTVVLYDEPVSLDPCELTRRITGLTIRNNVIETVTEIDAETSEVLPRLATSWKRVDDLTWRFNLREGVTFHDGTALDAATFVSSIDRTLDPALSCTTQISNFGGINLTATEVGDLVVEIKTEQPVPLLPNLMSAMPINAASIDPSAFVRDPVGTGPYRFVEWVAGQRIVLARNDEYWGDAPAVTGATYLFRTESAVRAAMVASGEADITTSIAAQDADNPETDVIYLNSETLRLRLDTENSPLSDVRVRQAVNLAIDRELLTETIFNKAWEPAKNLVMPSINGYNPDVVPYSYDPEEAKRLVETAKADGVDTSAEILYLLSSQANPQAAEAGQAIADMLSDVGLNVSVQHLEDAQFARFQLRPYVDNPPVHILNESHDNNTGDAGSTLYAKYHSQGGSSKLANPEVDALIEQGLAAENPERADLFKQVFAKVHDLAADVILYHQADYARINPRINYTPSVATNSELQLSQISFR